MTSKEIIDAYKNELGRAPTNSEIQYFMNIGKQGGTTPGMEAYEMQQSLQGTGESQQRRLMGLAGVYEQNLAQGDSQILQQSQSMLQGQFASMGRGYSSGYVAAFANAARDLALARQQAKAGFIGQGLGSIFGSGTEQGIGQTQRRYELQDSDRLFQQNKTLAQMGYDRMQDMQKTQARQGLQSQLLGGAIGLGTSILGGWAGGALAGGIGGGVGAAGGSMLGKYTSGQIRGNYGQY